MSGADPKLTVETPERVALELEVAGLGTRVLAWLVDALILFGFWMTLGFLASLVQRRGLSWDELRALDSLLQLGLLAGFFFVQWGYWVTFETLWRGRSPGKRALRIRIARLDGSPEGFAEAALRNLARAADFLPVCYGVALVAMLVDPKSRRVGDLLAGTVVVRERQADLSRYAASPTAGVGAADFEVVTGFLSRAEHMEPGARERLALKLAGALADRLQPGAPAPSSGAEAEKLLARWVGRG
jgi:uncharacterized RDD family membrane protein YckC